MSFDCEGGASSRNSVMSTVSAVSSYWDEGSVGTVGTAASRVSGASMMNDGADMPALSGLPPSGGSEDDLDDDEDDNFQAADNLDLGAVDLCVGCFFPCPVRCHVLCLLLSNLCVEIYNIY